MQFDLECGDILGVLKGYPDNLFDACLTDPPYGLKFMGKKWDHGVPSSEMWREVLRVLNPGGHMLAFGGTRTHHRLMCAIEDAGFEIRDCMMWLYATGFPKSLDIGKAIDKAAGAERPIVGTRMMHTPTPSGNFDDDNYNWGEKYQPITGAATDTAKTWNGYGTALKPAYELIVLAMKPMDDTFSGNALKWGVAGINIDGCRIPTDAPRPERVSDRGRFTGNSFQGGLDGSLCGSKAVGDTIRGRWPANLLLDEGAAEMLDAQSGVSKSTKLNCVQSGGASRFFYVAKASRSERGEGNNHPTVKPIKFNSELSRYLLSLLLPPEQQGRERWLLVPFCGSGSELLGARLAGWDYALGIDNNPEYIAIAQSRLDKAESGSRS